MIRRLIIRWLFGVEFKDYKNVLEIATSLADRNDMLIQSCKDAWAENEKLIEMNKAILQSNKEMLGYCNEKDKEGE